MMEKCKHLDHEKIKKIKIFFTTKLGISTLVLIGSALIICSFWFPYWNLTLKAPQYPTGLRLHVYMDHIEGDVSEVNILNHYIGMKSLNDAAQLERRFAWLGILAFALGAFLILPIGRKLYKVLYIPPIVFLVGFVADMFYWLYDAGHNLNPDAPVNISPFTPAMLGRGEIGQFSTLAFFGSGFFIVLTGILVIVFAITKKKRVCGGCADFQNCSFICDRPGSWLAKGKNLK